MDELGVSQKSRQELEAEAARLTTEIRSKDNSLSQLTVDLGKALVSQQDSAAQLDVALTTISQSQRASNELKQANQELHSEVAGLKQQAEKNDARFNQLVSDLNITRKSKQELEEKYACQTKEVESMTSTCQTLSEELNKAKKSKQVFFLEQNIPLK